MEKQELQKEIEKARAHLANMEKMLEQCEYERWKPKYKQTYYAIASTNDIFSYTYIGGDFDEKRKDAYNCFQTCEQAEAEAENILVRRMLEDIARRLNKGEKIDWKNITQYKYSFYLDDKNNKIDWCRERRCAVQGSVYCLDINFYNVAIKEIGEERLKKYLRGE